MDLGSVWHPFTQMLEWERDRPLFIERAEGNCLIDTEGKRYIDGVSSLWANVHGHGRRQINERIIEQLGRVSHTTMLGLSHPSAAILADRLVRIAPKGLDRVFYSESGSTAVEIALKIAYQYWRNLGADSSAKKSFLCLREGYHGDTLGAVSVGGIDLFHAVYKPLLFRPYISPSPHCYRCELDLEPGSCGMACSDRVEEILENHHEDIAAMIMEPLVQGAGGIRVAPKGYLARARELCRRYDVLFITDEVATGFGRTGTMFACEHEGVCPDIMTVGKGITGGYLPLAATLTTEKIFNAFRGEYTDFKTFFHGHTYTGNPLACAAALASLDIFERENVIEHLPPKIEAFEKGLERLAAHAQVGNVRQAGLMMGIELVEDKKTRKPFPIEQRMGHRVSMACRKYGAIIRPLGDVLVLMPPLSIRPDEIRTLLTAVESSIVELTERTF
ncbi:MAG: adenosylmethionine--8-amino-7-oxononanoate transaminase [Deltaproteobacteria bacterium]|nr:adenosylmethionine--8-amino-7-oxononanoate transaminase [Deltaproteobacteria bacterium]